MDPLPARAEISALRVGFLIGRLWGSTSIKVLAAFSSSFLILFVFVRMTPMTACKALSIEVMVSIRYSTL